MSTYTDAQIAETIESDNLARGYSLTGATELARDRAVRLLDNRKPTQSTPSPTFLLVQAAGAARDHWMKESHRLEGTPAEAAADAAYAAAEEALAAASKAHRAARRAHGDKI